MLSPLKPDDIGGVSNFAWVILCPLPTLSLLSIAHCCLLALSPFLPPVDMESSSRISALIWVSGARRMKMWVIIYNKFYLTLLLCLEYWLHLHSVVSYLENRHKVFFFLLLICYLGGNFPHIYFPTSILFVLEVLVIFLLGLLYQLLVSRAGEMNQNSKVLAAKA